MCSKKLSMSHSKVVSAQTLIDALPTVPCQTKTKGFVAYLRATWPEYTSVVMIAILTGSVYFIPIYHYPQRVVPMLPSPWFNTSSSLNALRAPTELTYPWEKEPLTSAECGMVVVLIPFLVIALFQFRLRSYWDLHAGFLGILKGVIST